MKSNTVILNVAELVKGTSTNASGYVLFVEMDKIISSNKTITLSLLNCPLFTSSFLNSSIGELFDKYGEEKLKGKLAISNAHASQIKNIKDYIDNLKSLHRH